MFHLIRYAYRKLSTRTKERNICVLGLDNAGKSSLLNDIRKKFELPHAEPDQMAPTVGQNVSKIEENNVKWTIWDIGGHTRFREIWDSYYRDVDILIWVLDASDKSRFQESIDTFKKTISDSQLEFAPICILANKQDISEAIKESEVIELFELQNLERKWSVIETSFSGGFEQHYGLEKVSAWLYDVIDKDPLSVKRTQWRKENKDEPLPVV